ncbi:MAG: hypothetical protein LKG27_04935 [Clostridiaceae bacterium]|jgi:hypothetical protein|nr:hypothetical protein [Clostridiaceae bacterium]
MFDKNDKKTKIIIAIRDLVNEEENEEYEEDMDEYCTFMKQMFLETSGLN